MTRLLRTALAAMLAAGVGLGATASAAPPSTGLVEVGRSARSPRLVELTMRTPALAKETKVRVLLPAGYAAGRRRYPVIYLLNGGGGSWLDWTEQGAAEKATAGLDAIVVMPDGGQGGNYTDWYGADSSGTRPLWATYHLTQLLPWVDRHFRTLADRSQRAVAGLSMGGNGALHYAARHPDLFVAAASFSGANDVFHPIMYPITETTEISNGALPGSVFGPRATEEVRWHASNPVDLAGNLGGVWVSLAFGNGQPGGPDGNTGVDVIETAVHDSNVSLHEQLLAAGVPHVYNDYGPGAHNWYYWQRDLRQALPGLMSVFAEHRRPPSAVSYSSIDPSYDVFGWSVRLIRPVLESSRLVGATPAGFVLRGSGHAVVRTPPFYRPGTRLHVVARDAAGSRTSTDVAGADGRLTVPVDLGPANAFQQYTAPAQLVGTAVREAHVTIS
jgi:S-formylglutathione hydrolase FrmB